MPSPISIRVCRRARTAHRPESALWETSGRARGVAPNAAQSPPTKGKPRALNVLLAECQEIEQARASARAGRVVSMEAVDAWIDSLGTDHELPPPRSAAEATNSGCPSSWPYGIVPRRHPDYAQARCIQATWPRGARAVAVEVGDGEAGG